MNDKMNSILMNVRTNLTLTSQEIKCEKVSMKQEKSALTVINFYLRLVIDKDPSLTITNIFLIILQTSQTIEFRIVPILVSFSKYSD